MLYVNVCALYLLLRFTTCASHVLNYDSVTICDGMEKVVRCPNKENIHVLQGFYGKWKNHDCNGIKMDPPGTHTCSKDRKETTKAVRNICQGKNQCTFIADKKIYGDPCPQSNAYLYITFFCMAPGKHIEHQKDKNNHEVVTVLTHGFLVSERKFAPSVESQPDKATVERTVSEVTTTNTESSSPAEEKPTNEKSELDRKLTIPTASPATDVTSNSDEGATSRETKSPVAETEVPSAEGLVNRNNIPSEGTENQTTLDPTERNSVPAGQKNLTVMVCNGERHAISCKRDVGMLILSAFYGKTNGKDCRGDLGYRDDIPDCVNPRALDSVKFLCENRKSCELASEKELFGDDTCAGVNKYLEVTYQC